jgi:hypothetical protein
MDIKDRVVMRTPLIELWTSKKILPHKRKGILSKEDIRAIIKVGPVEFVFANIGDKLVWIDKGNCFHVWKTEIEKHLFRQNSALEEYPGEYCYLASEWKDGHDLPIILLEKMH